MSDERVLQSAPSAASSASAASAGQPSRGYMAVGIWIIATAALGLILQSLSDILAPFALSVFIWLVMEGFAREIHKRLPALPEWVARLIGIAVVLASIIMFIGVVRGAAVSFAAKSDDYEIRINEMIANVYARLGLSDAPKLSTLIFSDASIHFIQPVLTSIRGMASDLILILIYVGFLYVSATRFPQKLVRIFPRHHRRSHAVAVIHAIRTSMEQYLWVQTVLSIITTVLTYVTLLGVGLDNALFWAFVVFVLNYIPTIGSIVAAVLPALFAIAQPHWPAWMPTDPMWCALLVFLAVSVWQFIIGNFFGPRMTGDSLNLSALVVLLSLAVWGALWGLTGMFLSAPLTVLVMIVLAQIQGARWIAILLSEDGKPAILAPVDRNENMTED